MRFHPKIVVTPDMTDDQIRSEVRRHPDNGAYAVWICRACGCFGFDVGGNASKAKILTVCNTESHQSQRKREDHGLCD